MADVADEFLRKHVGVKRKAGTKAHYEDVLQRIVVPAIGTGRHGT